jgi:hypothetical protein
MSLFYQRAAQLIEHVNSDSVFVEIGSEQGEGSTIFFSELAKAYDTVLHTVDISDKPKKRTIERIGDNVRWHINIGSVWAEEVFPKINKKIACLYLDNYDYIWDIDQCPLPFYIEEQVINYKLKYNIEMNNQNCQLEHMHQMLSLYPYMDNNSLVLCDDTYLLNDCWVGKSGGVVLFLLASGYELLEAKDHGVILINRRGQ